jgi:hypothetical protein
LQAEVLTKSTAVRAAVANDRFLSIEESYLKPEEESSNFLPETLRFSAEKVPQNPPDEDSKAKKVVSRV